MTANAELERLLLEFADNIRWGRPAPTDAIQALFARCALASPPPATAEKLDGPSNH